MELMSILKALISRLIFIGHGIYAVYLHYMNTGNMHDWFLVAPVALIVIEASVTLVYRKGMGTFILIIVSAGVSFETTLTF